MSTTTDIPDVTIIVVAHDVRAELERCFASIAQHAGAAVETILVDNASSDGTAAWVRAQWPKVHVIELARNEFGAARTHALKLARGRHTLFLDSDAALLPGALPAMAAALDANPAWGLVAPRLVYDDGGLQLSCRRYPPVLLPLLRRPPLARWFDDAPVVRHHLMADDDHGATRRVLYAISACFLFRTDIGQSLGGLDPVLAYGWEDADWCLRIRDAGGDVVYMPSARVVHSYRRLTARKPASRASLHQLRAHVHFQLKWLGRRRDLIGLEESYDREAAGSPAAGRAGHEVQAA